jgi:hypothetical protein
VSCEERNGETDGNAMAVWLATSSSSEGLINADRFLGRTVLTSGMFICFAGTAVGA